MVHFIVFLTIIFIAAAHAVVLTQVNQVGAAFLKLLPP